jgi:nicotinamide phosphoribosyltransferase
VFRPDSGDPVEVLCGLEIDDYTEECSSLDEAQEYAEDDVVSKVRSETPHGEQGESEVVTIFKYEGKVYQTTVSIEWNRHDKQYYYEDGHSSTEPVEIELTPEQMGAVELLYKHFGGDLNEKGYIEVCNRVGLIYGDSISLEIQGEIYRRLAKKGFSSGNVVFGVGSYTYQYVTRDTFGMAMKATYAEKDGVGEELFKDPITDIGSVKKSAKGLIRVEKEGDDFVLYDQQTWEQENGGALETVFEDGNLLKRQTLAEIRERLGAFKF